MPCFHMELPKSKVHNSTGTSLNTDELRKVIKNKENQKVSFKFLLWMISETYEKMLYWKNSFVT